MTNIVDFVPIIIAIISAVVSGVTAVWAMRKDKADGMTIYENLASKQAARIDTLQSDLDEMRTSQQGLEQEVGELRSGIYLLIKQITDAGLKPVWKPVERRRTSDPQNTKPLKQDDKW